MKHHQEQIFLHVEIIFNERVKVTLKTISRILTLLSRCKDKNAYKFLVSDKIRKKKEIAPAKYQRKIINMYISLATYKFKTSYGFFGVCTLLK